MRHKLWLSFPEQNSPQRRKAIIVCRSRSSESILLPESTNFIRREINTPNRIIRQVIIRRLDRDTDGCRREIKNDTAVGREPAVHIGLVQDNGGTGLQATWSDWICRTLSTEREQ